MTSFMKPDDMIPANLLTLKSPMGPKRYAWEPPRQMGNFRAYDTVPRVQVVAQHQELAPKRQTIGAAGFDIRSAETSVVPPHGSAIVDTGISLALAPGTYASIRGRSSLAFKNDVTAFEGTIDSDYRGPIKVKLFNHSNTPFEVVRMQRIAQLIVQSFISPQMDLTQSLDDTVRGMGGFGSTGTI